MATLQELEQALVNADKAGDLDAARRLASVLAKARQDVTNQIPDTIVPGTTPEYVEPSIGEKIVGTGEAALTLATGATGGTVGMIGGTLKGLAEQILSGQFGSQEAANLVEKSAMQGARALTYEPRTQSGQEQVQAVGEVLQNVPPVIPVVGPIGAVATSTKMAAPVVAATAGRVAAPVVAATKRAGQAVAKVAEPITEMMPGATKKPTPGTPASGGAAGVDMATLRQAKADELPVPIKLTEGQKTRQFEQQRFERETAKLPEVGAPIRERFATQNKQLQQNLESFIDMTGAEAPDLRSIGLTVDKALRDRAARDKTRIRTLYKEAEKAGEMEAPVSTKEVVDILNASQSAESTAPVLVAARRELVRLGGAIEDASGQLVATKPKASAPGGLPVGEKTLKPGVDGVVWLTKDSERAMRYARQAAEKNGGDPVVVRVRESESPQDPTNFGDAFTRAVAQPIPIESKIIGQVVPDEGYWYHGTSQQKSSGGASLANMEQLRKFVNKVTGNDPTNIKFAGDIKRAIDASTDGLGGNVYKQARAARAQFSSDYENIGLVENLLGQKRGSNDRAIAMEDVLRRSVIDPSTSLDTVRQVRRLLQTEGPNGQQAWKELQGGTLKFMRDEATKGVGRDELGNAVLSPAQLDRVITQLDKSGKLDFVFGKKGAEQLRTINDVAKDVLTSPAGTVNTSNTASVLAGMMDIAISGTAGVPAPIMTSFRLMTKGVKDAKTRARVKKALGE